MDKAAEDMQNLLYTIPNVPTKVFQKVLELKIMVEKWEVWKPNFERRTATLGAGQKYDLIDFDLGVKITGAGFRYTKEKGARLQRALINSSWMRLAAGGYEEIMPPGVVNAASGYGTGQLPDKEGPRCITATWMTLYLIPTAEVPVTNIYRDVILDENSFLLRTVLIPSVSVVKLVLMERMYVVLNRFA